jgi:hypothetical protein
MTYLIAFATEFGLTHFSADAHAPGELRRGNTGSPAFAGRRAESLFPPTVMRPRKRALQQI